MDPLKEAALLADADVLPDKDCDNDVEADSELLVVLEGAADSLADWLAELSSLAAAPPLVHS